MLGGDDAGFAVLGDNITCVHDEGDMLGELRIVDSFVRSADDGRSIAIERFWIPSDRVTTCPSRTGMIFDDWDERIVVVQLSPLPLEDIHNVIRG
jgi:hypothetical protein